MLRELGLIIGNLGETERAEGRRPRPTRRAFLVSGAAASHLVTQGCARRRSGRIAIIPKTTAIDYWENMHAGAAGAASRLGLRIFWNGPQSETNFAQQALMLEDVIQQHVDGIVLAPSHESVLASGVRHARAEGIPVVVVDSPVAVDPGEIVAYIGSDPERIGTLAAIRIGAVLDGKGDMAIVGVSPTVEAAVRRERAVTSVIGAKFPGIRIVEVRYGLSDHARSHEIVSEMLATRPHLAALFASDQFAVRGALIAIRAVGSRPFKLIGVAQERDLLDYVRQGSIDSLVVQDPYSMGRSAVEILGNALRGSYSGPARIQTRVAMATRENLTDTTIQELVFRR